MLLNSLMMRPAADPDTHESPPYTKHQHPSTYRSLSMDCYYKNNKIFTHKPVICSYRKLNTFGPSECRTRDCSGVYPQHHTDLRTATQLLSLNLMSDDDVPEKCSATQIFSSSPTAVSFSQVPNVLAIFARFLGSCTDFIMHSAAGNTDFCP